MQTKHYTIINSFFKVQDNLKKPKKLKKRSMQDKKTSSYSKIELYKSLDF